MKREIVELLVLLLLLSCGKKEPPPSPDRWPPKLVSAKALDNLHVSCYFSEELEATSAEGLESYTITGTPDSLRIIAASLEPGGDEVILVTSPQKEVDYSILVQGVKDLAGNEIPSQSHKLFQGSLLPDTTPPRVTATRPADADVRAPYDVPLSLTFSEPLDTTTAFPLLLPSDVQLSGTWSPSLNKLTLNLGPSGGDSLRKNSVYNLFLPPSCQDLGGNRLRSLFRTTFSTGDSLPKGSISGTVSLETGSAQRATILLLRGKVWGESSPFSATQVEDTAGGYTIPYLPEETYFLLGVRVADGSRWAGAYGAAPPKFAPQPLELPADTSLEGIDFILYPESSEVQPILQRLHAVFDDFTRAW